MTLNKIQAYQNVSRLQETSSARKMQEVKSEPQMGNLSEAELNMITNAFPEGANKKLELYLATGSSLMENPDARGNHFDYRV